MRRDRSLANDQTLACDNHPLAVLLADCIDAAEAGNIIAGIDLEGSAAVLDQGSAIAHLSQRPAFHHWYAPDFRFRRHLLRVGSNRRGRHGSDSLRWRD